MERFLNIEKAVAEMAACNNSPRTLEALNARLYEWLNADGGYTTEALFALDAWLGTLSEEEISVLVDGEETEMEALAARGPAMGEGSVMEFFTVIFEDVI